MSGRTRAGLAGALCGLALIPAATAAAHQAPPERFFAERLLADRGTSATIKGLLREDGAFVDPSVAFRDVTGDKRADAVVRVLSGGAAGAIGFYVLSTDGRPRGSPLRVVYRNQRLLRAYTRVRRGVLSYRVPSFGPSDELCCPTAETETVLRWQRSRGRFRIASRRRVQATVPSAAPTRR